MLVAYPTGRMDILYRDVEPDGSQGQEEHTLMLLLTDKEARGLASIFSVLADKIDEIGGRKQ
jgi:hypothetical protein